MVAGTGLICVSIAEQDQALALHLATQAAKLADVLEIRLDALDVPDFTPFLSQLHGATLLFTCRPQWEGGRFQGDESTRVEILTAAAAAGAAYVDVELRTAEELRTSLIKVAQQHGTKVIVSWHDFKTTASSQALASILQEQYRSGADWGKIVTTARDFRDVLRVLSLQEEAAEIGFPLCAFCMGETGTISRIATLDLGGAMTYAAPDGGRSAAPGQLPVSTVHLVREMLHGKG